MTKRRRIDPRIDCVFKAILGREDNKNLLIHFLNAIIGDRGGVPISDVTILNPYSEKDFVTDKLSILDIRAMDDVGNHYQVEIQLAIHPALTSRILYTWSGLYHSLIREGEHYSNLDPAISIWILNGTLFPEIDRPHLKFNLLEQEDEIYLTDHLSIHLLQLPKWNGSVETEKDRWFYLFQKGGDVDPENPPKELTTSEMRQVMAVLKQFSESEEDYQRYLNRLDANLLYNTWMVELRKLEETKRQLRELEKEKQHVSEEKQKLALEKEKALEEKEKALEEKQKALEEKQKALEEKQKALDEKQRLAMEKEVILKQSQQALKKKEMENQLMEKKLEAMARLLKEKGIEPPEW